MPRRAQGGDRLRDENIDHRVLELARDVGPARVVERTAGRLAAHERQRRGLEAAEAHVEVAARKHRPRQRHGAVPSRLREARQRRSAGIRQTEQLGRLVEGLAGRVVLGVAQQPVLPDARDFEQLAVTAGHQQRDERKPGLRLGEQRREQMALHVMHADRGLAQRVAERAGDARAHQQRAGQAGPLRVGDAVEVGKPGPRLGQHPLREGHDPPHMIAGGELGHDAAIDAVHRHLRVQRMREQPAGRVVDGHAGFVAGGFDAENEHGRMPAVAAGHHDTRSARPARGTPSVRVTASCRSCAGACILLYSPIVEEPGI